MDIEKKMESTKEIWNKNGSFLHKMLRPYYEELETAEENLSVDQKRLLVSMLVEFLFSSIDAWKGSMPKKVKKGIMKHPFFAEHKQPFIGRFISDNYNSNGEHNMDSFYNKQETAAIS